MSIHFGTRRWLLAAEPSGGLTVGVGTGQAAADTIAFGYSGQSQSYQLPSSVYALEITAAGGGGGNGDAVQDPGGFGSPGSYAPGGAAGPGAQMSAEEPADPGDTIAIQVGGQGDSGSARSGAGQSSGSGAGGSGAGQAVTFTATVDPPAGDCQPAQAPTITEQIQPQLVKPSLHVADSGPNAIGIYSTGATGRRLLGTISGSQTGLNHPEGVVLDSQGNLYVANATANTITEYAPDTNGNTGPITTVTNAIDNLIGVTVDPLGFLDVSNAGNNTITAYQPNSPAFATGNATPAHTLRLSAGEALTRTLTGASASLANAECARPRQPMTVASRGDRTPYGNHVPATC